MLSVWEDLTVCDFLDIIDSWKLVGCWKNGVQGTNLVDRIISVLGCLKPVQNSYFRPDRLFSGFLEPCYDLKVKVTDWEIVFELDFTWNIVISLYHPDIPNSRQAMLSADSSCFISAFSTAKTRHECLNEKYILSKWNVHDFESNVNYN